MSEPVPEQAPARRSGGSSVFTRQIGPLPLWAWMGIATAVAVAYWYYKNKVSSASTAASTTGSTGTDTSTSPTNDIPQFVNQTYVSGTPPTPGPPGPTGPAGAPGSTGKTGSPGPTTTPQANEYPAPTGLKYSKLSNTSVKLTWNYITSVTPKPSSYTIAAYNGSGKLVSQTTVNAPDTAGGSATATLSGLPSSQKLQYHVWANGGKVAPPHASVTGAALWLSLVRICKLL